MTNPTTPPRSPRTFKIDDPGFKAKDDDELFETPGREPASPSQ